MKGKEILIYDAQTDELIGQFDSVSAASYEYEVSDETINKSCKGLPIKGDYYFREGKCDVAYTNQKRKVYQYDAKTGLLLNEFESALEAHQKTGIPVSTIRNNCRGVTKTVCKKQYIFRSPDIEYKPIHPEPYIQKGKPKPKLQKAVDVFSIETDELLGTFDSLSAAAQFIGCKPSNISTNINDIPKRKTQRTIYKKYYCRLHNE